MLNDNLIRLYAASFRANFDLPALTDYFKEETFTYGGAAVCICFSANWASCRATASR